MNTTPQIPAFFTKPGFRAEKASGILNGSARRALAAFDTGYRFSCAFFPVLSSKEPSGFSGSRPPIGTSSRHDGLSADELERLLERNLLPRFDDERPTASNRNTQGFSPELIELGALLVIVGVVLAKLFVA